MLKDDLNRISASWADNSDRRLIAVLNSAQHLARECPSSGPGKEVLPVALPHLVPER